MQIVNLQPSQIAISSKSIKDQYSEAVQKSVQVLNVVYDEVAIFTCHWKLDDTGGSADCRELINKMSRLHGSRQDLILTHIIDSEAKIFNLPIEVMNHTEQLDREKRSLFIFHYAGHATAKSTSNDLILTEINPHTQLGDELDEKYTTDFSLIKKCLILASSKNPKMDVLMLMDCCCAAVAGRGGVRPSGRVEFVAATTPTGIANTRVDGQTFTQAWCTAFQTLFEQGHEFTTNDIIQGVNADRELAQFPLLYVNREGAGIPITFIPANATSTQTVAKRTEGKVMLVAFHIAEVPEDRKTLELLDYLETSAIPARIVMITRTDSSLLLAEIAELVLEFMRPSFLVMWPSSKKLIFENGRFKILSAEILVSKILKRDNKTLPSQVNVILGPPDSAPIVWGLEYDNDILCTIVWQESSFRLDKALNNISDGSMFYWNEGQDGTLRRIRLHPNYSRNIIGGEIWISLQKLKYSEYDGDAGEQIPFVLE